MYEWFSLFTLRDMKHSIKYTHFQCLYKQNFDGQEKFRYFEMSWIWSPIILFGAYMFL